MKTIDERRILFNLLELKANIEESGNATLHQYHGDNMKTLADYN